MEENVSDALLMAGAMLIFIIALTFSMSSFTTMRSTIQEIFEYEAKIDLVKDEHNNYLNYMTAGTDSIRIVGIETVLTSIYRLQKENFKVYINTSENLNMPEYDFTDKFDSKNISSYNMYEISINSNIDYKKIYEKLSEKTFKEYLGVYQEDTGASEENKPTYRVITYVEI